MVIEPAALIGALLGLGIGWIDYKVVKGVLEGRLRAANLKRSHEERMAATRRYLVLRNILFVVTVGGFAVVGFFFGRALGG
jgi:hypothetical protein